MSAEILWFPGVDTLPAARPEDCDDSMMDVAYEIVRMGAKELEAKVRRMADAGSERLLYETDMALMETLVKFTAMSSVIQSARRRLKEAAAAVDDYSASPPGAPEVDSEQLKSKR
jgi:hypothetical protein